VLRNNAVAWSERFLFSLKAAAASRANGRSEQPARLPFETALAAFRDARSRVLFLDYDGSLVGYASRPRDAVPTPDLVPLLTQLASDRCQRVVLVSGRPREPLEQWFGRVPGLWLAAEHGAILRAPDGREWEPLRPHIPVGWKERVQPVLEHFVDRTPGSFIEEKEYSLVWHYRMSDPEFGEWLANELVANLEEMLAETELIAVRGHKSVEVKLNWANKGEMVGRMDEVCGARPDFYLAVGDDRTDEDLFARLPPDAWTIHVGEGPSRARFRLPDPPAVRRLLSELAALVLV
jgi:trehalose 6-phosphate synthase/phosphatase